MTGSAEDPVLAAGSGPLDVMSLAGGKASPEALRGLLREVIDPEIGINIVDLGLVYDVGLSSDGVASIRMTLTTPGCPLGGYIDDEIHNILWGAPGVSDRDLPAGPAAVRRRRRSLRRRTSRVLGRRAGCGGTG
jgi:metal-sulfur cluster biosynthetic enzyme